jgi:tRNA (cmo5U34)-methyltransferase
VPCPPGLPSPWTALSGIEKVGFWQGDFRDADLPTESYDVIFAAAVLHHLRDDEDWQATFEKIWSLPKPGGSVWITDLVVRGPFRSTN